VCVCARVRVCARVCARVCVYHVLAIKKFAQPAVL